MSGFELGLWIFLASMALEVAKPFLHALLPTTDGLKSVIYKIWLGRRLSSGKWEIEGGKWVRKALCKKYLGDGNYCTKRPGHRGRCNYA